MSIVPFFQLAGGIVVTGCKACNDGGMAVRELGNSLSGRVGAAQLDLDAVLSDLIDTSVNKVELWTSRANHFALDPGLA